MNLYSLAMYILVSCIILLQAAIEVGTSLTSINHSRYVIQLYQKLHNVGKYGYVYSWHRLSHLAFIFRV